MDARNASKLKASLSIRPDAHRRLRAEIAVLEQRKRWTRRPTTIRRVAGGTEAARGPAGRRETRLCRAAGEGRPRGRKPGQRNPKGGKRTGSMASRRRRLRATSADPESRIMKTSNEGFPYNAQHRGGRTSDGRDRGDEQRELRRQLVRDGRKGAAAVARPGAGPGGRGLLHEPNLHRCGTSYGYVRREGKAAVPRSGGLPRQGPHGREAASDEGRRRYAAASRRRLSAGSRR